MIHRPYAGREATLDGETLTLAVMGAGYIPSFDDLTLASVAEYEVQVADAPDYERATFAATWDSTALRLDVADASRLAGVFDLEGATLGGYVVADGDGNLVRSILLTSPVAGWDAYPVSFPQGIIRPQDIAELVARVGQLEARTVAGVAAVGGDVPAEDLAAALSIEAGALPDGGTTGQALVKASDSDGDAEWGDVEGTSLTAAPVVAILAADAVDGTGDEFQGLTYDPSDAGGGIGPAGWAQQAALDVSSLAGYITLHFGGSADCLVYCAGVWSVRTITAADITDPWPQVNASVVEGGALAGYLRANLIDDDLVLLNASEAGAGVLAGLGSTGGALKFIAGKYLDAVRYVTTYYSDPVPDLATLMGGPVDDLDQPVGDDGTRPVPGDLVAVLADSGSHIRFLDRATGQWSENPSDGAASPSGAESWPGTITTNALDSGAGFVCYPSGVIGTWIGRDADGYITGQPANSTEPTTDGSWSITDPAGGGATEGYVDAAVAGAISTASADATTKANAKVADAINDGTTTVAPSQNAVFDALALKVPTSRLVNGVDLSADRTLPNGEWNPAAVVCWQDWYNASTSPAATPTRAQNSGRYTGGYLDTAANVSAHWIEFALGRLDAGTWSLRFFFDKLAANGEFTLSLGLAGGSLTALASLGGSTSTLNMYASSTSANEVVTITGIVIPTTGRQVLRATNTGTGGGSSYGGRWMLIKPIRTA